VGGFFATELARALQERVSGVVIVSGQLFTINDSLAGRRSLPWKLRIVLAMAVAVTTAPVTAATCWLLDHVRVVRATLWPFFTAGIVNLDENIGTAFSGQGGLAATRLLKIAGQVDVAASLKACPAPVDAVAGRRDPLNTRADTERLTTFTSVKRVVTASSSAHWPIIEQADLVAAVVAESVTRDAGGRGADGAAETTAG
jgi:pimeloyl-ACP methyl ester carboxylesterase